MRTTLVLLATALVLAAAQPGHAGASVTIDRVVAVVNGDIITMSDLQREEALKKVNDERLLLDDMIDRKLQMSAAKQAGLEVSDKELADAIADIQKRNGVNPKQFEEVLLKDGLTLEQYKTELREQMTLSRTFNKFVRSGLAIDEAEVRRYYDRSLKNYTLPEEVRVRQMFFRIPENAGAAAKAEAKQKAEAALARAQKGEDFTKLVKELSEGENAATGGDLGFMQRGQMISEIEEATRSLKPGQIAGPVLAAGGYNILKVEEVRTPVKPFERVKDEITRMLYEQKMETSYRTWLQSLRSEANIENRL